MLYLDGVPELKLWGVYDRNVPNKERVVLQNLSPIPINLGHYFLSVGVGDNDAATPIHDTVFWFGDLQVDPGTWVYVYTGPGSPRVTTTQVTKEPAIVAHWGRNTVLFSSDSLVPLLFRTDGLTIGSTRLPLADLFAKLNALPESHPKPALPKK